MGVSLRRSIPHVRVRRSSSSAGLGLLLLLAGPRTAMAGMPSLTLTEIARMRLETISFFLLLLLLSAALVMWIWNRLRRDFTKLPRLGYGQALGLVSLWGMLFLLVLTMISGARELMTPGAWEKDGATYKLVRDGEKLTPVTELMRRERMLLLKAALWDYAESRGGALPPDDRDTAIPAAAWETPDASRARYVYVPGRKAGVSADPVAYEPTVFYTPRLMLTSDGEIRFVRDDELQSMLGGAIAGAAR